MDVRKALLVAMLSLFAGRASALMIEFRADQYSNGTDVSNVSPGIFLQGVTQIAGQLYNPTYTPITSRSCVGFEFYCGSHTGTSTFHNNTSGFHAFNEYERCGPGERCFEGYNVLEMIFEEPTDYLGLETTWASDPTGFIAYDIHGNRILQCAIFSCGTVSHQSDVGDRLWLTTFSVQREQADIARVVFGGEAGVGRIGAIRYSHNVPEPGTIGLFLAGLLGVAVARRRLTSRGA